jgi:hypothetical protein
MASRYTPQVVAIIDTASSFGATVKQLKDNVTALQTQMSTLLGDAPESLDTLNEIAAAISDDPTFFSTMSTANTTLQNNIDTEATTRATVVAALQALVDAATTARGLLSGRLDTLEADATTGTALAAVQADVDANEADRKTYFKWDSNLTKVVNPLRNSEIEIGNNIHIDPAAGYATQFDGNVEFDNNTVLSHGGVDLTATFTEINAFDGRLDTLEADPTTAAAVAAVQADVDQNETDADAAIAAVQADVDQNETDADLAIAAANVAMLAAVATVQADVDQNETDADAAIAAVQADVDQNESDADTAIALKANIDAPTFTGTATFSGGGTLAVDASDSDNFELNKSGTSGLIKLGTRMVSSQKQVIGTPSFDTTLKGVIAMMGATSEYKIQNSNRVYIENTPIVLDNGGVVTISDNNAAALDIKEGSNSLLKVDTTNSSENVEIGTSLSVAGNTTLTGERLFFSNNAALIRLKDNQAAALTIENQDASADEFVVFNTQNAGLSLTTKQPHQHDNTLTVGVDDTGYDVKLFGDTASAYVLWDASADDLILAGGAGLVVPEGQFTLGSTAVTSTAAELNYVDGVTSNVQTQLDAKAPTANATMTGTTSVAAVTFSSGLSNYANDTDAAAGGIAVGQLYRHNSDVKIRVS